MRPAQRGPLAGSVVNMNKNLKKVATYGIDECTPICDVKTAREHLKECKSYIVDDAVWAFESVSDHEMLAIDYIDVRCGLAVNAVTCCGYVWTGPRTAGRWWFCYCENVYTGKKSILILDDQENRYEENL